MLAKVQIEHSGLSGLYKSAFSSRDSGEPSASFSIGNQTSTTGLSVLRPLILSPKVAAAADGFSHGNSYRRSHFLGTCCSVPLITLGRDGVVADSLARIPRAYFEFSPHSDRTPCICSDVRFGRRSLDPFGSSRRVSNLQFCGSRPVH